LVVVGVASVSKEIGARGSVVALDQATGAVIWQTYMVSEGADGAGVFAVPAIDETRGGLYVGAQNAYSPTPAPFGNPMSVVALKLASGELLWAFYAVPGAKEAPTDDIGFSASSNLFSAEIDGGQKDLLGVGQKSGGFYTLDRKTAPSSERPPSPRPDSSAVWRAPAHGPMASSRYRPPIGPTSMDRPLGWFRHSMSRWAGCSGPPLKRPQQHLQRRSAAMSCSMPVWMETYMLSR
jgi:hypothetical protein